MAESVANLACVGAHPVAVVNCCNFGNPEHPEVMWQLSEAIDGMSEACRALGLPVIGGNVSLYNESAGVDIEPTPVIGALGLVERLAARPPGIGWTEGSSVILLDGAGIGDGSERPLPLGGSRWAVEVRGRRGGVLPPLDLASHRRVCAFVAELVAETVAGGRGGLLGGVHDVSDGGLAVTLAEMAVRSGVGLQAELEGEGAIFGEAPSRFVVASDDPEAVLERAAAAGVGARLLGLAGGDRLVLGSRVDLAVAELEAAWRERLPAALGE